MVLWNLPVIFLGFRGLGPSFNAKKLSQKYSINATSLTWEQLYLRVVRKASFVQAVTTNLLSATVDYVLEPTWWNLEIGAVEKFALKGALHLEETRKQKTISMPFILGGASLFPKFVSTLIFKFLALHTPTCKQDLYGACWE